MSHTFCFFQRVCKDFSADRHYRKRKKSFESITLTNKKKIQNICHTVSSDKIHIFLNLNEEKVFLRHYQFEWCDKLITVFKFSDEKR
jgi:hypothetical protein